MTATAEFWRTYSCRNGYAFNPDFERNGEENLRERLRVAEERIEILAEWVDELRRCAS